MQDEFSAKYVDRGLDIDPRNTAVLVVGMLNDFCKPGGAMVLCGYERLVRRNSRSSRPAARRAQQSVSSPTYTGPIFARTANSSSARSTVSKERGRSGHRRV